MTTVHLFVTSLDNMFVIHGGLKRQFINFLTKMLSFTSHGVGNPVQITKSVALSALKEILKLWFTFVESLVT